MCYVLEGQVWNFCKGRYTGSTLALLARIAFRINPKSATCYPSIAGLSEELGISESQTRRCMQQLEADGVLHVERSKGPGGKNLYRIDIEALKGLQTRRMDAREEVAPAAATGSLDAQRGQASMRPERIQFKESKYPLKEIKEISFPYYRESQNKDPNEIDGTDPRYEMFDDE